MKRFNFRFQRILDAKEKMEEAHKIALGKIVAVLNRERGRLADLERAWKLCRQGGQELLAVQLDPFRLGLNVSYLQRLQREIHEQQVQIQQVERTVEEKRRELLEATKERRVYEILKERAVENYRREQKRQEKIMLDEIGGQLYLRRGSQESEVNL